VTDSTAIIVAAIVAIPPTLTALAALRASKKNAVAIEQVHVSINSRMDELLAAATGEARAEGREAGRGEPKP